MNNETVSLREAYIAAGFSKKSYPAWVRRYFSKELLEFPGIDSLKIGNFYVPLKRVYAIIANITNLSKNKEKVMKWISEASKKLNVPNELPLFSILSNPLFKECYSFMMDFGKFHNNINGMSFSLRAEQVCDLSKRQKKLLENILLELGISLCLPIHLDHTECKKLLETHTGYTGDFMKLLNFNGFVDDQFNGPLVTKSFIDSRIPYILIIRHLWK